jgi:hypothetical protein
MSIRILASVLIPCVSCSTSDTASTWTGAVTDSAGVSIVTNPANGIWNDGEGWTVEETLRIGMADGDPDYLFGRVSGICVSSDGRIHVVDAVSSRIAVYSEDGEFLNTVGRRGAGPGELESPLGPCLMGPGDTLNIPDLGNFRVARYAADGSAAPPRPFTIEQGIPLRWDLTDDGRVVVQLRTMGMRWDAEAAATPDAVVVWGEDGTSVDTLLLVSSGSALTPVPTREHVQYVLLAADPVWQLAPDGRLLSGFSDDYRITIHDRDGVRVRVVTRDVTPRPVTAPERRTLAAAVERIFEPGGALSPALRGGVGDFQFAEFYPAFLRFEIGVAGSLWVQPPLNVGALSAEDQENLRLGPEDPDLFLLSPRLTLGALDWDVFDAEGRYLGVVALPERFEPMQFVEDAIYGVWKDEMDVEYVVRLKLVGRL